MKPSKLTTAEVDRAIAGMCTRPIARRVDTRRPVEIPTRRPLHKRLIRAARLALLHWKLTALLDEREHYTSLGYVGPQYLLNSTALEIELRDRIRQQEAL
jgi:hypothetical protein